jgi:folate-binding protein YgfZ
MGLNRSVHNPPASRLTLNSSTPSARFANALTPKMNASPAFPAPPQSDPRDAVKAASSGPVSCVIRGQGILRARGADAGAFLQGQLTNDVGALSVGAAQLTAWCSAKGRVLANGVLWRSGEEEFLWLLPATLLPRVLQRLRLFVLRAKVALDDATADFLQVGVAGAGSADAVRASWGSPPEPFQASITEGSTVLALPGERFLLLGPASESEQSHGRIASAALPRADEAAWDWITLRAGIPLVTTATQEAFVPQMLNWEILGGVNFRKGCYPGQEIVARTQHRTTPKERTYLVHVSTPQAPESGDPIHSPVFGEQACGRVVNVAPAPEGGHDVLAVLQTASARDAHLQSATGPSLALLHLPYEVPGA